MVELSTGAEDIDAIKNIMYGVGVSPVELYVPEKVLDHSVDAIYAEELDVAPEETKKPEVEYHDIMDENADPIGDDKPEGVTE